MRRKVLKRLVAYALLGSMLLPGISLYKPLRVEAYTAKSATIDTRKLNIRAEAGMNKSIIASLSAGTSVTVIDELTVGSDRWYKINFNHQGSEKQGFAHSSYVKINTAYNTDNSFEAELSAQGFPESYKLKLRQIHAEYPKWRFKAMHTSMTWEDAIKNQSIVGRNLVRADSISSWKSVAQGAYNWSDSTWPTFDGNKWVAASQEIIRYYMDPRNFLDSSNVFQFLKQNYDANTQVASGVETLVKSTFMESRGTGNVSSQSPEGVPTYGTGVGGDILGVEPLYSPIDDISFISPDGVENKDVLAGVRTAIQSDKGPGSSSSRSGAYISAGPGAVASATAAADNSAYNYLTSGDKTYVDMIMTAATQSKVNPYVLTSMLIQEQGVKGTSGLISGNTPPYTGHYNYFNIQAYHAGGMTATQRGLWWASQSGSYLRPWNTREKAIVGGAMYYGEKYVAAGQDTFYLKKFNVQGANPHKHQYMTYVEAAAAEGVKISRAYSAAMKDAHLEFSIPVYKEMPDSTNPKPEGNGSPNNKLSGLSVDGYNLSPSFNADTGSYDIIVDNSVSAVNINASALDSRASVSGAGSVNLNSGSTQLAVEVRAENGTVRKYTINVARRNASGNANNSSADSTILIGPR